ncbi:aspartyl-tRNA synthetase [Spiroplasma sp. TIUS-1]|uniref:aspartate--tRNA ligase n=1 Tax=Spiroplasma sp. TIUS-1 TaxID=216963 RepID=UPI0013977B16|nr:aspartate--tRNA ligase [Spiroplasma sp. TIUS-1]QHX35942.1 aspartyl-tRNA synthetase [Spiroplasma sp. TIUS-1]
MRRTHTCGELNSKSINKNVVLQGWVAKVRKMGGMNFVDLRDQYGITQLIIKDSVEIKNEYVIEVEGKVIKRKSINEKISTGEIEIEVTKLTVINKSLLTPFEIKDDVQTSDDTRMKYRYLDIRRPIIAKNLIARSKMNNVIRNYFTKNNFIEIETPIFGKSTPEGARDFLVPSRINKHHFYALPQSPQLYKQLFMVGGIDRYFQIAKCFRDEDLRIDRQPEFTQLDMEMAFAKKEDVMAIIESLMVEILKEIKDVSITKPFKQITWDEAIDKYGIDKPDLRFGLEIKTLNKIFSETEIPLFTNLDKKSIRAICVEKLIGKKELERLSETSKQNGINILGFAKFESNNWSGSIGGKLSNQEKLSLINEFNIKKPSTLLFVVDEYYKASKVMGALRNEAARIYELADSNKFELLWVIDFPLYEFSEEENRFVAAHHPFTMPQEEFLDSFDSDMLNAKAAAYDIVMNGFEIGGGSQRITDNQLQARMFKSVGLTDLQVQNNFGWFVNAYNYGAPYHAGLALGLDRIIMILTGAENIRDVIAFPKNSSGIDMMNDAPSKVDEKQLLELQIKLK